jgi:hypothetical protein
LVLQGIAWTAGRDLAAKDRIENPGARQKGAQ